MKESREGWLSAASISLITMALAIRWVFIPFSNGDMQYHNLVWYETLANGGILQTLGTDFSNYTPPYTYLLALATLTRRFLPALTAIKLIPICFDILNAIIIYSIVRLKYPVGQMPMLAAALFLSAPTVILNSSYWGQVDALYTTFLLLCLYHAMRERPQLAILSFGVALAVKAQAIFLLPFLFAFLIHRKVHFLNLLLIPAVYLLMILPAVLLGRPLIDALTIYTSQADTYQELSKNAPNLYILLPNEWYSILLPLGMLLTLVLVSLWLYNHRRAIQPMDQNVMMLYAITSVMLMPYLLPKMHERYFYAADVLSIVLLFFQPSLWFIAVMLQVSSTLAYMPFLLNGSPDLVIMAAILNTVVAGILLRRQNLQVHERSALAGQVQA